MNAMVSSGGGVLVVLISWQQQRTGKAMLQPNSSLSENLSPMFPLVCGSTAAMPP